MTGAPGTIPKNCGIRLEPPSVILYYEDTESGRIRRRIMPLRHFTETSDVKSTVAQLKEKNSTYLDSVPDLKLEKLLRILQEALLGSTVADAATKVSKEFCVDPEEDLNKLDSASLDIKKSLMNKTFEANRKKPGDQDFQYDVDVNFELQDVIETSGWDSDMDDPVM